MSAPARPPLGAFQVTLRRVGVLSAPLVLQYWGVDVREYAAKLPVAERIVEPVQGGEGFSRRVTLVWSDVRTSKLTGAQITQVVGTAATLLALGARPGEYLMYARALGKTGKPSAEWWHPRHGRVAVEFDPGRFSEGTRASKVARYREANYVGLVWGMSSEARAEELHAWLSGMRALPVVTNWWTPIGQAP